MLKSELQATLNKNWENCWPVSDLRPLAIIDLISYLFFIKKIDDQELIHQKIKLSGIDNFIYSQEIEEFTWSSLENRNAREIHQIFTKEPGLINLMNHYAKINSTYSDYFKAPLLIEPTPKLLSNAIEIINIIESNDQATRENIVEYLFTRLNDTSKNNQAFLPDHILKLIISLAEPVAGDIIFDPAAANGNLLLSAFRFIQSNSILVKPGISKNSEIKLSGCEPDGVLLRIAAMNIKIHSITDSNIHLTPFYLQSEQKPSLIISSLPTSDITEKNSKGLEKESTILNDIADGISSQGRAVVLVPQDLLQSEEPDYIKTRKKLIEHNNLQGVISLPTKNGSLFSGAAILIFDKSEPASENIWFYNWKYIKKKNKEESLIDELKNPDFEKVAHILEKWKTRNAFVNFPSANSFFIPANYLRSNNYKLSYTDYKLIKDLQLPEQKTESHFAEETGKVIAAKRENLHEFFESGTPLMVEKQKKNWRPYF